MEGFIKQRRRWINGTFAGYVYLLFSRHLIDWKASLARRIIVFFIVALNLIQMMALVLSPVFSFVIFRSSLAYLLSIFMDSDEYDTDTISLVAVILGWLLWIAHVVTHNKEGKENQFHPTIISALYALSGVMTICLFGSLIAVCVKEGGDVVDAMKLEEMSIEVQYFLVTLFVFSLIAPFFCALLVDKCRLGGVKLLFKTVIPFFLSFYLMIPWFSSYAFARCWDLTWGNRPAGTELDDAHKSGHSGGGGNNDAIIGMRNDDAIKKRLYSVDDPNDRVSEKDKVKARFRHQSRIVVFVLIVINLGLYGVPLYYLSLIMGSMLLASSVFMLISLIKLAIENIFYVLGWTLCFEKEVQQDQHQTLLESNRIHSPFASVAM